MDYSLLPSTAVLTEALKLVEQRNSIEIQLKAVTAKLISLGGAKISKIALPKISKATTVKVKAPKSPRKARSEKAATPDKGTGKLKDRVLGLLKAAGSNGIAVTDLASTLQVAPANIHVWFATTGKKNPSIQKVGRGIYAWKASEGTVVEAKPTAKKRAKAQKKASIPEVTTTIDEKAAVELQPVVEEVAPVEESIAALPVEPPAPEVEVPIIEEKFESTPDSTESEVVSEEVTPQPREEQQDLLSVDQTLAEHHA
jgi:hypothetical protein